MTRFLLMTAATLLIPAALFAADPAAKADKKAGADAAKKLLGEYQIIAGEKYGEAIPAERLKDNMVIITDTTIAVVDRDKKNLYSSSYKISKGTEKGVWYIDLTSEIPKPGEKALGLIQMKGKQASLIYSLTDTRPTSFETGEKELMFKMKKMAKPANLPDTN